MQAFLCSRKRFFALNAFATIHGGDGHAGLTNMFDGMTTSLTWEPRRHLKKANIAVEVRESESEGGIVHNKACLLEPCSGTQFRRGCVTVGEAGATTHHLGHKATYTFGVVLRENKRQSYSRTKCRPEGVSSLQKP